MLVTLGLLSEDGASASLEVGRLRQASSERPTSDWRGRPTTASVRSSRPPSSTTVPSASGPDGRGLGTGSSPPATASRWFPSTVARCRWRSPIECGSRAASAPVQRRSRRRHRPPPPRRDHRLRALVDPHPHRHASAVLAASRPRPPVVGARVLGDAGGRTERRGVPAGGGAALRLRLHPGGAHAHLERGGRARGAQRGPQPGGPGHRPRPVAAAAHGVEPASVSRWSRPTAARRRWSPTPPSRPWPCTRPRRWWCGSASRRRCWSCTPGAPRPSPTQATSSPSSRRSRPTSRLPPPPCWWRSSTPRTMRSPSRDGLFDQAVAVAARVLRRMETELEVADLVAPTRDDPTTPAVLVAALTEDEATATRRRGRRAAGGGPG